MNRALRMATRLAAVVATVAAVERAMAQTTVTMATPMAHPVVTTAIPIEAPKPEAVREVVINIPALTLELFENGERVKAWAIAVGKRVSPTPLGTFRVANRVTNPTWYGPKREVIPSGPKNPVGTRWIGLDAKGYGIHGTNAPKSIGRAASHGCIRMKNRDVEELFELVRVGDAVRIEYEVIAKDGTKLKDIYELAQSEPAAVAATATGGGI